MGYEIEDWLIKWTVLKWLTGNNDSSFSLTCRVGRMQSLPKAIGCSYWPIIASILSPYYEFQATTDSNNEEEADDRANKAVAIIEIAALQSPQSNTS